MALLAGRTVFLTLALQALPVEPVEEGAAVVAPRQALVALGCESVGHVHLEADLRVGLQERCERDSLLHEIIINLHNNCYIEHRIQPNIVSYINLLLSYTYIIIAGMQCIGKIL